jgi:hypothetical protein
VGHRDIDVTIATMPRGLGLDHRRARERSRHLRYGVGMRLGLMVAAVLASGCGALDSDTVSGDTDDFIDMDTPPGNCSAGTSAEPCPDPGTSGSPEGGPCIDSQDCASGNACIAPFVGGEVGDFVCASQCIAQGDEAQWCLDASACCELGAVCSARGLCMLGGLDDTGTAGDGTAGDGTAGTGTDGTGSSGGSTTEGTASDTGAATETTGMR